MQMKSRAQHEKHGRELNKVKKFMLNYFYSKEAQHHDYKPGMGGESGKQEEQSCPGVE